MTPSYPVSLRVWSNGTDIIVANSPAEATEIWEKALGERIEDYPEMKWKPIAPNKELKLDSQPITAMQLLEECGRGYVGSPEW